MPSLNELLTRHSRELQSLRFGMIDDLSEKAYQDFFTYYLNKGEMTYGVAKAREGDPRNWVQARVLREVR